MEELHELIKYLKDNGYAHLKINPDLLVGIIEYFASKQEPKQCTITDVVGSYESNTYTDLCKLRKQKIWDLKMLEKVMKDVCAGVGRYTGIDGNYKP